EPDPEELHAGTADDADVGAVEVVADVDAEQFLLQIDGERRAGDNVAAHAVAAARSDIDVEHRRNLQRLRFEVVVAAHEIDELADEPDAAVTIATHPE